MNKQELLKKITEKKEFSDLPTRDVEIAFERYNKEKYSDEEKVKFTRDLLRKVFSAFTSKKILSLKNKDEEWILRKHLSTRERLDYYEEIYKRILRGLNKKINIVDLGAGINGFSYKYFKKIGFDVNYYSIEAVGQLVNLVNHYFDKNKLSGKAYHLTLFEVEEIKKIIKNLKKPPVVFIFKTIDSLEMLKRDYSKQLIQEITPLSERVVLSFSTRSMMKKTKFHADRSWITDFIRENFEILDNFELETERYIVFCKRD
ncbi:MAG: hypothetical protein AABW81_00185 [Nanoarchaeota archaeon]